MPPSAEYGYGLRNTIAKLGSPDGLVLEHVPDLLPGEGEVVIEVSAVGVGPVDVLKRRDGLGGAGPGYILGGEVAGTIIRVGVGVDQALIGRRVSRKVRVADMPNNSWFPHFVRSQYRRAHSMTR